MGKVEKTAENKVEKKSVRPCASSTVESTNVIIVNEILHAGVLSHRCG